jgi:hypothetical protein
VVKGARYAARHEADTTVRSIFRGTSKCPNR